MCRECPLGGECKGGANVIVKPGYWRATKLSEVI